MVVAKVFMPVARAYTEKEFSMMEDFDAERSRGWGLKKIIGEKEIVVLSAKHPAQIKVKILALVEENKPLPLFIRFLNGNTLDRTFIALSRHRSDSRHPIVECVDYTYNKRGKAIVRFLESCQKKYGKKIDHFMKEMTGTTEPWSLPYRMSYRRQLIKRVEAYGMQFESEMYSELAAKFGINTKRLIFPLHKSIHKRAYRTSSEAKREAERYGNMDSLSSVLYDYIEEKGRFIATGPLGDFWIYRYRKEIHPELLTHEEFADDSMSFGEGVLEVPQEEGPVGVPQRQELEEGRCRQDV